MEEKNCPCCPNHCSKDNLGCHRGHEYFENTPKEPQKEPQTIEEQVFRDLKTCGHMLHHGKNLSSSEVLSNLTRDELEQLHNLLSKIID